MKRVSKVFFNRSNFTSTFLVFQEKFQIITKGNVVMISYFGVACQTSLSQLGNARPSSMAKTFLRDVLFFFGKSNDTRQLEFRYTTPRITGLVSEGSVRVYIHV